MVCDARSVEWAGLGPVRIAAVFTQQSVLIEIGLGRSHRLFVSFARNLEFRLHALYAGVGLRYRGAVIVQAQEHELAIELGYGRTFADHRTRLDEVVQHEPEFAAAIGDLPIGLRRDDAPLVEAAKAALRKLLGRRLQKRPLVDVHLLRV